MLEALVYDDFPPKSWNCGKTRGSLLLKTAGAGKAYSAQAQGPDSWKLLG